MKPPTKQDIRGAMERGCGDIYLERGLSTEMQTKGDRQTKHGWHRTQTDPVGKSLFDRD